MQERLARERTSPANDAVNRTWIESSSVPYPALVVTCLQHRGNERGCLGRLALDFYALNPGALEIAHERLQLCARFLLKTNPLNRKKFNGVRRIIALLPGAVHRMDGIGVSLPVGFEVAKGRHGKSLLNQLPAHRATGPHRIPHV